MTKREGDKICLHIPEAVNSGVTHRPAHNKGCPGVQQERKRMRREACPRACSRPPTSAPPRPPAPQCSGYRATTKFCGTWRSGRLLPGLSDPASSAFTLLPRNPHNSQRMHLSRAPNDLGQGLGLDFSPLPCGP